MESRDKFKEAIDRAERFKTLQDNPVFQEFIGIVKEKKKEFENVLHNPKPIGALSRITMPDGRVELVKYTQEEDTARIKEAQFRSDTFGRVVTLVDDTIRHADRLKELKKQQEEKDAKKNGTKQGK